MVAEVAEEPVVVLLDSAVAWWPVTVKVRRMPLEDALRKVAEAAGVAFEAAQGRQVYLFRAKEHGRVGVLVRPGAVQDGLPVRLDDEPIRETIPLRYAAPSDVAAWFAFPSTSATTNRAPEVAAGAARRHARAVFGGEGMVFGAPEGIVGMVGYDLISMLIVLGRDDAIKNLRRLIERLDLPPRQIQVDARFVVLPQEEVGHLGIAWVMLEPGADGPGLPSATGNFDRMLTALVRNGRGRVIDGPRIVTENARRPSCPLQGTSRTGRWRPILTVVGRLPATLSWSCRG